MGRVRSVGAYIVACLNHPKHGLRTIPRPTLFVALITKVYLAICVNSARRSVHLGRVPSRWRQRVILMKNMNILSEMNIVQMIASCNKKSWFHLTPINSMKISMALQHKTGPLVHSWKTTKTTWDCHNLIEQVLKPDATGENLNLLQQWQRNQSIPYHFIKLLWSAQEELESQHSHYSTCTEISLRNMTQQKQTVRIHVANAITMGGSCSQSKI